MPCQLAFHVPQWMHPDDVTVDVVPEPVRRDWRSINDLVRTSISGSRQSSMDQSRPRLQRGSRQSTMNPSGSPIAGSFDPDPTVSPTSASRQVTVDQSAISFSDGRQSTLDASEGLYDGSQQTTMEPSEAPCDERRRSILDPVGVNFSSSMQSTMGLFGDNHPDSRQSITDECVTQFPESRPSTTDPSKTPCWGRRQSTTDVDESWLTSTDLPEAIGRWKPWMIDGPSEPPVFPTRRPIGQLMRYASKSVDEDFIKPILKRAGILKTRRRSLDSHEETSEPEQPTTSHHNDLQVYIYYSILQIRLRQLMMSFLLATFVQLLTNVCCSIK